LHTAITLKRISGENGVWRVYHGVAEEFQIVALHKSNGQKSHSF
jgi:hypothetical protein